MATKQKIEAAAAGILQHRGITIEQLCEQYLAGLSRDAPDWTRTSDLRFRRPTLYPTELRARVRPLSRRLRVARS